jgi:hypothetical protein
MNGTNRSKSLSWVTNVTPALRHDAQISVDQEGNLYITEVANDRSQKFRPKPNADPAKLVGMMVGTRR